MIASEAGRRGLPNEAVYCASKFAQVGPHGGPRPRAARARHPLHEHVPRRRRHRLRDGPRPDAGHAGAGRDDGAARTWPRRSCSSLTRPRTPPDPRSRVPPGDRGLVGMTDAPTPSSARGSCPPPTSATEKVIPGMPGGRAARSWRSRRATRRRAATVADELGIPRAHGSYEALLADPDVDAVYIPLPNHLHAEWTIAAARAGKHVLCEKPLAMTAADAERMVGPAPDAGVALMEAFMYRLHPSWVAVREVVASRAHRPADRGPELVLVLQRRPGQHPQHPRGGWRRAVRHRLLQRQPVADAVRRASRRRSRPPSPAIRRAASTS